MCFKLTDGFGAPIGAGDGTYYTDSKGEIVIPDLEPGTTVTAQEVATVEGFVLNGVSTPVRFCSFSPNR